MPHSVNQRKIPKLISFVNESQCQCTCKRFDEFVFVYCPISNSKKQRLHVFLCQNKPLPYVISLSHVNLQKTEATCQNLTSTVCNQSAPLCKDSWQSLQFTPHVAIVYIFLSLHVIVTWYIVRHILIGRSHPLLHRIENNTVRTRNSDLICQGWRGEERIVTLG